MNIDIIKESMIEYIENIYALSINYLKNNNSIELKNIMKELELFEDRIRLCDDLEKLNSYKKIIDSLIVRIEGIINE